MVTDTCLIKQAFVFDEYLSTLQILARNYFGKTMANLKLITYCFESKCIRMITQHMKCETKNKVREHYVRNQGKIASIAVRDNSKLGD